MKKYFAQKNITFALLFTAALAQNVFADENQTLTEEKLDTVLVTATRTEQAIARTLAPATVFTENDIENFFICTNKKYK